MDSIDLLTNRRSVRNYKDEKVAALIVYGYESGEHHNAPKRKEVEEILRFID